MKNFVTNATLIAASVGILIQQTVAGSAAHERRKDEQVIRIRLQLSNSSPARSW